MYVRRAVDRFIPSFNLAIPNWLRRPVALPQSPVNVAPPLFGELNRGGPLGVLPTVPGGPITSSNGLVESIRLNNVSSDS